MSGVWTTARIRQEIDRLTDWRRRLVDALTTTAQHLETLGQVPDDSLLTDLTDYRQRMRTLAWQVNGQPPSATERLSLNRLEFLLQKSQQCEAAIQQLAVVEDLEHVDQADYGPLKQCGEEYRRLKAQLAEYHDLAEPERGQLLQGEHPLQAVLRLVDATADLTDDEWSLLQERVGSSLGRAFAAALVRGKIRRRNGAGPVPVELPPAAAPVAATVFDEVPTVQALAGSQIRTVTPSETKPETSRSTHVTEDDLEHSQRWFQSGSSILPGMAATSAAPATESSAVGEQAATDAAPIEVPVEVPIRLELSAPVAHTSAAAVMAREITNEMPRSAARVNALVQLMVREDRIALAAHLAHCAERLPSGRNQAPSPGLLRALALGKSLAYSRGELARAVDQELKPFVSSPDNPAIKDDVRLGTEFLLRAAALLPALLGASPSASAILRSFAIEPGLSQLYNYCHRVALFGERLQSQAVELFQAPADQSQWNAERKQLQDDVRAWLERSMARGVHYQRSSPLFAHAHWTVLASPTQRYPHTVMLWTQWQEVLLRAHRLLKPIADTTAQRHDVRQELSRAMALVQPGHADQLNSGSRESTPYSPEMQDVLLEAVDLANRWLRLQSATPARGQQLAPEQAEELRTELLERADSVLSELDVVDRTRHHELVQTGIACLSRAVQFVRQLCAGEMSLPLHEPDAKQVLYGEFLMMPHVELDEHWRPMGEPTEQEQAVLDHISSGWADWRSAFALQCQQEDHLATTRLLEMPVWNDPRILRQLHRIRGEELQRARQAVLREIDGLASQASLDQAENKSLDGARAEIHQRLERLRIAVPQVLSLGPLRGRLERCRERWQRVATVDAVTSDAAIAIANDDSGVLLSRGPVAETTDETPAETSSSADQWIFLEE